MGDSLFGLRPRQPSRDCQIERRHRAINSVELNQSTNQSFTFTRNAWYLVSHLESQCVQI